MCVSLYALHNEKVVDSPGQDVKRYPWCAIVHSRTILVQWDKTCHGVQSIAGQ